MLFAALATITYAQTDDKGYQEGAWVLKGVTDVYKRQAQETIQTDIIEKSGKILNPRTIDKDGNIVYVPIDDW